MPQARAVLRVKRPRALAMTSAARKSSAPTELPDNCERQRLRQFRRSILLQGKLRSQEQGRASRCRCAGRFRTGNVVATGRGAFARRQFRSGTLLRRTPASVSRRICVGRALPRRSHGEGRQFILLSRTYCVANGRIVWALEQHIISTWCCRAGFREGNGRTQLSYLYLIGLRAGRRFELARVLTEPMLSAMIGSFHGQFAALEVVLQELLIDPA